MIGFGSNYSLVAAPVMACAYVAMHYVDFCRLNTINKTNKHTIAEF